jgi:dihydroflavonol-4-reductase
MTTDKVVLVTGAAGYIAGQLVKQLLELGYTVHGTVRSLSNKSRYSYLTQLPNASTHLKLFEADLSQEGAFDDAIAGTSIVFHTASPANFTLIASSSDPQRDVVDPAIQGTLNVLKSAAKTTSVKRVVVTSSNSAIHDPIDPAESRIKPINEESWNTTAKLGAGPGETYCVSKVEAEKAAWNYVEQNKDKISFDLVVINPTMNYGPYSRSI